MTQLQIPELVKQTKLTVRKPVTAPLAREPICAEKEQKKKFGWWYVVTFSHMVKRITTLSQWIMYGSFKYPCNLPSMCLGEGP